jgi:hypothetical protein
MVTAAFCSNPAEAELLRSLLEENGIDAFVLDDSFGGAIRLQVASDQAEEAKKIIEEAEKELGGEGSGQPAPDA